jgi:hypothetical protein
LVSGDAILCGVPSVGAPIARWNLNSHSKESLMKRPFVSLFALVTLILALSFPVTVPAAPPAELHPELQDAITALRRANQRLQRVGGDWGGHKEDTLKATNAAIVQLQQCLPYDHTQ